MALKAENAKDDVDGLEELTSEGHGSGLEAERPEEVVITAPFDPAKIDVITHGRTIDLLLTRLREGELDLSPDFQRRSNLWTNVRKSSLIESLLLRIPIPSLYVSEDKEGNYTVVDGLQRFCAIAHFVDVAAMNKALDVKLDPMRLTKLESLTEYDEKAFLELPRPLRRRINETELTLHIIRASTPDEVKFNIFSRINRGGLPLTAQEIRNAVYRGEWRPRVKKLAESKRFLKATDHKIKGERMEDLELVLRFIAHFTLEPNQKRPDVQNLDTFLNATIKDRSVHWGQDEWVHIEQSFFRALEYAPKIFGRIAFRKYSPPGMARRPINRGLFETETVVLARRTVEELRRLSLKTEFIIERFNDIFETDLAFRNALLYATGRGRSSNERIETIDNLLNEALHA